MIRAGQGQVGRVLLISLAAVMAIALGASCRPAAAANPGGIGITVAAPAGPAPAGAPVEARVPFPQGEIKTAEGLVIAAPDGKPVAAQFFPAERWPNGSIRWLGVVFEAVHGPGHYRLQAGKNPVAGNLLKEQGGNISLDTGALQLTLSRTGKALFDSLDVPKAAGGSRALMTQAGDLLLTRYDGKIFRSSLAGDTRKVIIEQNGPLWASLRVEGKCRAEDGESLLDFIIRLQAYKDRPELSLAVTWINATDHPGEELRDIRLVLPYQLSPDRLVFGCDTGVWDGPWLKGWPVSILQEDHNWYWARTRRSDGRWLNFSSGGANGAHFPGWLYLSNTQEKTALGVFVPNFWQEYPNEIAVNDNEISVGLWPEGAAEHLASKPLVPIKRSGQGAYQLYGARNILPHPYLAFFDGEKRCLDLPQGVAKTQEIILGPSATGPGLFEKQWWAKSLQPVPGFVDPAQLTKSRALGLLWPRDPQHYGDIERMWDEAFGWFDRHIDRFKCYGKFDYGDFRYMVPAPDYRSHPGAEGGGEMSREGYWHNNERDPLRGLFIYYLRTGNPRAWELCRIAARHLMEVDLRHYPHYGLYTHSYGHCYAAQGRGGEPDHSWLLGALEWSGYTGDPVTRQWMLKCGDYQAAMETYLDFNNTDARTVSVALHILSQCYLHSGEVKYLQAAKLAAEVLLQKQNPDGSWPAYLDDPEGIKGFTEHAAVGLADYWQAAADPRLAGAIKKALVYTLANRAASPFDKSEGPLAFYAAAIAGEKTGDPEYTAMAAKAFGLLVKAQDRSPDPIGRGDNWAEWGVYNPTQAEGLNRPPQLLEQTRPMVPAELLAYTPSALWLLAQQDKLSLPKNPPPLAATASAPR
jgi:hypothetical protein